MSLDDAFPLLEASAPRFEDTRGWLQVLHESGDLVLKRSFSRAGVFRGLHAQLAPAPQTKIIRVVSGRIVDVLASLDDPQRSIVHRTITAADGWVRIAAHFAHGFYACDDTVFEYICQGRYDPGAEQAFSVTAWLRDVMGIVDPILSDKDRLAPPLHPVTI
ncbi:MAG: dTDP-4-dehydrorhamnose 3,5-epimerase [Sphingomonas sp.]|uniref:dTDP-4-dehydrorhamnose 3,5-epimerase family protein n=1 Tax=Sphingomonas sp. TaxID=28214 RepID=UPI0025E5FF05|nr:dTDP-4-dehydrorhamnose 3,5-epimerase family protein [Sphingomonas sp.]MBX9881068.1 dTDP-4-dehydrorhamnose 3,5-epimerase [Sphingomonas sp.]